MRIREQKLISKGNSQKGKLLIDESRFYGIVVSTLDSEYKDPSLLLGRTSVQFFFHYVEYKGQKWLGRKPVGKKNIQGRNHLTNKS